MAAVKWVHLAPMGIRKGSRSEHNAEPKTHSRLSLDLWHLQKPCCRQGRTAAPKMRTPVGLQLKRVLEKARCRAVERDNFGLGLRQPRVAT